MQFLSITNPFDGTVLYLRNPYHSIYYYRKMYPQMVFVLFSYDFGEYTDFIFWLAHVTFN